MDTEQGNIIIAEFDDNAMKMGPEKDAFFIIMMIAEKLTIKAEFEAYAKDWISYPEKQTKINHRNQPLKKGFGAKKRREY